MNLNPTPTPALAVDQALAFILAVELKLYRYHLKVLKQALFLCPVNN
jgi:hypothetical protein